ncbi:MAG: DNA internalization-related competence protein ComEC/Rec2 [Deltaproteobacteria bacterium]|nr:DNA internalization-related competence protein ComEC/Rec2 [Deltaproteobacteria bacterium]
MPLPFRARITAVLAALRSRAFSFPQHALLFLLMTVYLSGALCAAWGWSVLGSWWVGGGLLLIGGLWWSHGWRAGVLGGGLLILFAFANGQFWQVLHPQFASAHLRQLALPQKVTIEGWLFRAPEHAPHRGRLYVEALRVWENNEWRPATGKVLITVRTLSDSWHYGNVLRLTLNLRQPRNFHTPGAFDYAGYLARQHIFLSAFLWNDTDVQRVGTEGSALWVQVEQVRHTISKFFAAHLETNAAAVLQALIIGDERFLTEDLRDTFSRTGVAHVLSISGLHISLVAMTAYGFWWWVVSWSPTLLLRFTAPVLASVLAIPPVLLYASISGGNVATWRSVLMVLTYLFATLIGRQGETYRSLAFAALLISVLWPGAFLDVSFQLSFVSVLSLFLATQRFTEWWDKGRAPDAGPPSWRERLLRWGGTYLAISVGALLGTLPLTAAYFNQVSLLGLVANAVVVPLLGSAAVILGLLAAGFVFLHSGIASVLVGSAGVVIRLGIWTAEWLAAFPYAAVRTVTPNLFELLLLYGLLSCVFFRAALRQLHAPSRFLPHLLVGLLLLDVASWWWHRLYHDELRITFLDVGQGDAAVVELPNSQVMVIDGGGFASENFDAGEALLAPFLWSRKIQRVDMLVLSHPQLDHYGGLTYLTEHFAPREFWSNGEVTQSGKFPRLQAALTKSGVRSRVLCREMRPITLDKVRIQVLHPPCEHTGLNPNNASLVLRLSYGSVDVLFTGDIEAEGEAMLLAAHDALASEIVKVPHHGSRTSSTSAFVRATAPSVAVASLGFLNRFHFPAPEVVRRYEQQGGKFLRTDEQGAITLVSDGREFHVRSFLAPQEGTPETARGRVLTQ